MASISRREALQWIGLGSTVVGLAESGAVPAHASVAPDGVVGRWRNSSDRVWLGAEFWANPMEDWRLVEGAAECQSAGGDRNIHLLTHELTDPAQPFAMQVTLRQLEIVKQDGGAGFRLGLRSDIGEYRANCFAKGGLNAGWIEGQLALAGKRQTYAGLRDVRELTLSLVATPRQDLVLLELTATDSSGKVLGTLQNSVPAEKLLGNIALVNNFDPSLKARQGARYRFVDWSVTGKAFRVESSRKFGPILWSMYSLSDSREPEGYVFKITALTGPVGMACRPRIELQAEIAGEWKSLGESTPDTDAWTTTFRIPNWDARHQTPYRLIYREQGKDGRTFEAERTGLVKANPEGRPLRMAALTCQNDYAFPYEPVANNVLALDPDLVYFSGDQLYENHGGYGVIRDEEVPAILNYLRKFYQFGWSFGEVMRDRPTLCIPDDHDVFHGNLWGEAGKKMAEGTTSSAGGYRQPARMVNVVHKTCVSHHPDVADPTPVLQDISTYYGDMVYGNVGFLVLADRQWKSGPEHVDTGTGRADHVLDPNFDTTTLDKPGLVLLGERQEKFLEQWMHDWRGHAMKVVLSQTVFAGLATHHGGYDGYLKADLDSGSWPQTARNRTIRLMKPGMPLHINGDQHLTTLSQYGADQQRDGCWSFCTPAIAVGYPRWWRPDELNMPHKNRPAHGLPDTGEYTDSFGNFTYVYAVGNPEVPTATQRYEKAHQKGSGFGFVTIDTVKKTYFIESFRFLVDAKNPKPGDQFPGWPVTIHQRENGGDNLLK